MPLPRLEPMLASAGTPGKDEWIAEPKLDGWWDVEAWKGTGRL